MHLGQVLDRLASAGFTLRATKCAVGVDPVGGLGRPQTRPQTGRGGPVGWSADPEAGGGSVGLAGGSHRSRTCSPQLSERMSSRSSGLRVSEHELVNTSI